ncbi:hypothetical protein Tco_0506423 [Tanacetum coccineum]
MSIVLKDVNLDYGLRPFLAFDIWLEEKDIGHVVEEAWKLEVRSRQPDCRFHDKLKNVKVTSGAKRDSEQLMRILKEARKSWMDKENNLKCMLHQKDRINLMVNGLWCEDPSLIKAEMVRHYKTLFSESGALHPIFCCDHAEKISGEDATMVEKDLSKEEILDMVCGCGGDKALRPDWFNFKYIRKFWDILEWDLIRAIRWFVENMEISNDCNSLFMTIIPKATDPIGLGDFRPISLIRCNYKIIVKVLAERIKRVVGKVVGMCKMLLSTGAYDSLNGRFLSDMMKKTRFRNKWCSWIKSCIRSSTMLILVSGSPTKEFCLERRVRANEVELRNMARWMRCGIGEFPFTYLGLLIGENMRRVGAWNTVVEKFKNRLSDWKAKSISFGGSLTLVKSVQGILPLYYFSVFHVLLSVLKNNLKE